MKKYLLLVLIVLVMGALVTGVLAAKPGNVPHQPAGGSNIAHAYLYEKDENWDIVEGGAWGKMKYNQSGETFDFVFNGHGLEAGVEYILIYYPDPWPGDCEEIDFGVGVADVEGNVHIEGSVEMVTNLPAVCDDNQDGAKIWLVLSSDWDDGMIGWNPESYLFEYDLIEFDCTLP